MCQTHSEELYYDYLTTTATTTTTTHSEYLYTTGNNPTSPKGSLGFGPEAEVSTQSTLERGSDVSGNQLGMSLVYRTPPWVYRNLDRC